MKDFFLVGLGSALGGMGRYGLATLVYRWLGRGFPYGTLVVNCCGCFLMGFLFSLIAKKFSVYAHSLTLFLLIGLLGGFTTYSAFGLDTYALWRENLNFFAVINVFLHLVGCIGLVVLGCWLGEMVSTL